MINKESYGQLIAKNMINEIKRLNLNTASVDDILNIINKGMTKLNSINQRFITHTVKFIKHSVGCNVQYDLGDVNFYIKEDGGHNFVVYKSIQGDISIPYQEFLYKLSINSNFETHSSDNYRHLTTHINKKNIESIIPDCKPCNYTFYRARIINGKPNLISELSYPPTEYVKFGRANRDQSSIFYCSAHPLGAITEVRPKINDYMVISKWRMKDNLNINLHTFEESALVYTNSINKSIISFFCNEFKRPSKNDSHYKITAALAEFFLLCEESHGISYSPATDLQNYGGKCRNFALKTQFVDNYMELNSANFVQFKGAPSKDSIGLLLIDYALPVENTVIWTEKRTPISASFIKQ